MKPSSQSTSKITRIVHNIGLSSFVVTLKSPKIPEQEAWGAMSMPIGEKADGCARKPKKPAFLLESKVKLATQAGPLRRVCIRTIRSTFQRIYRIVRI